MKKRNQARLFIAFVASFLVFNSCSTIPKLRHVTPMTHNTPLNLPISLKDAVVNVNFKGGDSLDYIVTQYKVVKGLNSSKKFRKVLVGTDRNIKNADIILNGIACFDEKWFRKPYGWLVIGQYSIELTVSIPGDKLPVGHFIFKGEAEQKSLPSGPITPIMRYMCRDEAVDKLVKFIILKC